MEERQLKILGFLCNWCSYAGADLAGISRLQIPPLLRVIRILCSGSLDPQVVLTALKEGSDGVIIMGCHPGDCHYLSGNYEAFRKYRMLKKLLSYTDMESDRLHLEWVSASEGIRFQKVVTDFTDKIKELGPNPIRKKDENAAKIISQLDSIIHATKQFRLRSLIGREKKLVELGNAYGEKLTQEELDEIEDQIIENEYIRSNIVLMVENEPKTVEEMAENIGIPTEKVFQHVAVDIGFQIHTGFDGFKIGAIVKNIGRKFAGFSLPFSTQVGVSYKSSIGMFKADELTIVLDSVISQVQAIGVILGLEYSLLDMLHIRLGYNRNEAQAGDDFLKGFSVGMGFNLRQYSINYSFSPDSILGSGHRVTLQAKFGPEKTWRKKAKAVGKKKKSEYLHDFMR